MREAVPALPHVLVSQSLPFTSAPITPTRRTQWQSTALAALVLLAAASCTDAPKTNARNVLLITIDTLRADRLGAYGYARPTSPAIDELAGRSIVSTCRPRCQLGAVGGGRV